MEKIAKYRTAIEKIVNYLASLEYSIPGVKHILVKDADRDHYLVIRVGWSKEENLYSIIAHIAIVNEKVWIYVSNIDMNLEEELNEEGVSKEDIIFGGMSPSKRQALGYPVL